MISLYLNYANMRLTVALSRLPTSIGIRRTTIVPFVMPQPFTYWMRRNQ
jgi:hypothetical protein